MTNSVVISRLHEYKRNRSKDFVHVFNLEKKPGML